MYWLLGTLWRLRWSCFKLTWHFIRRFFGIRFLTRKILLRFSFGLLASDLTLDLLFQFFWGFSQWFFFLYCAVPIMLDLFSLLFSTSLLDQSVKSLNGTSSTSLFWFLLMNHVVDIPMYIYYELLIFSR